MKNTILIILGIIILLLVMVSSLNLDLQRFGINGTILNYLLIIVPVFLFYGGKWLKDKLSKN